MAPAFICCTGSRVTAPAVFSSLNAKGRDSLHGVDVPDRVRVCTRRGTRHVTRARHSRVSLPNCPWKQSFEKKNLGLNASSLRWRDESCIRECKQRVQVEVRVTESRKSANRLPRCAIARRHAPSLCAASGTVAPPLLDGPKSVASTARTNMCASIGLTQTQAQSP